MTPTIGRIVHYFSGYELTLEDVAEKTPMAAIVLSDGETPDLAVLDYDGNDDPIHIFRLVPKVGTPESKTEGHGWRWP